jgi:hypothetical protein
LNVSDGTNGNFTSTRTKYVRTDAVTEYFATLNTHWLIYNAPTSRFFFADPYSNHVFVMDATTRTQVGSITVPGAFGIDDTPDHSVLYVGTTIGDVYTIDPVAMAITKRYVASEIGPYGFQATAAQVLADGTVALLGVQRGIPSVDGSSDMAIWNPVTNALTAYYVGPLPIVSGVGVDVQSLCPSR